MTHSHGRTPSVFLWLIPTTLLAFAAVCWPLFQPGMLATRDMLIPPHPALPSTDTVSTLRSQPQGTILAVIGRVMDAGVAVRLLLAVAAGIGALGVYHLTKASRTVAPMVLGTALLIYNPFSVERLLQGQWSLLMAAWILPALAAAGLARSLWLVPLILLASLTPTGWILAVITALTWWCAARGARPARRTALISALVVAVAALPWALPAVAASHTVTTTAASAHAFAARAQHGVATLGALAGFGGIWNGQVVSVSRSVGYFAWCGVILALVWLCLLIVAWRKDFLLAGRRVRWGVLIGLAVAAIGLPAVAATGPGLWVMGQAMESVPGAGLLRDTSKFVCLAIPCAIAGGGAFQGGWSRVWAGTVGLLIFLNIPTAVVDVRPLTPVPVPDFWVRAQEAVGSSASQGGQVVVLPAGSYRMLQGRPVVEPAGKFLPLPVADPGALVVSGSVVGVDNPQAWEVVSFLSDPSHTVQQARAFALDRGVRWLIVEQCGSRCESLPIVQAATVVVESPQVVLMAVE